jgi:hypothetical protein
MIGQKLFPGVTLAFTLLAGLLASGCSKSPAPPASAEPKSVNLGTVELGYNTPERRDLGDGAVCVLTAAPMDANSCELVAVLERSGKKVASSRIVPASLDRPLEISFGNVRVGLILHIK